jgi:hypothetical protein
LDRSNYEIRYTIFGYYIPQCSVYDTMPGQLNQRTLVALASFLDKPQGESEGLMVKIRKRGNARGTYRWY